MLHVQLHTGVSVAIQLTWLWHNLHQLMYTCFGLNQFTVCPLLTAEADYTPGPYVATFNPGETIALVSISTQDTDCAEPLEAFRVDVQLTTTSAELGVTIGSPSQANVVIRDPTGW